MSPHQRKVNAIVSSLLEWYPKNARDLPWRRTKDPYRIYVSEIMLQQTQVKAVMPYWRRWMKVLPDIEALACASPETILKLWEGLGYYTRVRNMQRAAQQIVAEHGGKFPRAFEDVLQLPGVGRYTAGAICSIAFNQPCPVLDGNVIRVLTRVYGIAGEPKKKEANATLWGLAEKLVQHAAGVGASRPEKSPRDAREANGRLFPRPGSGIKYPVASFNQALMELGAMVCTPRQPQCETCPLNRHCVAFQTECVHRFPRVRRRSRTEARRFVAIVVQKGRLFLVHQRPAGVVNANLWEFPNAEVFNGYLDAPQAAREQLGLSPRKLERFCSVKHSITRYRITLEVFRVTADRGVDKTRGYLWADRAALDRLPFTSAHRKIIEQLTAHR